MAIHNSFVGDTFNTLADLLEIEGANPFRVRAYRNAARVVSNWPKNLSDFVRERRELPSMPGLGKDLMTKVREILSTGRLAVLEEVQKRVPRELSVLLEIPGLGPKRVLALRDQLGVQSIEDLREAAESGKLHDLPGFGEKTEERILKAARVAETKPKRLLLSVADQVVHNLLAHLKGSRHVRKLIAAGSYRRRQETVGDIDILMTATDAEKAMDRLAKYEEVEEILARGPTKLMLNLRSGVHVDLRIVPERSYGAALHYFTGSKSHNIEIRKLGVQRGLKINEYGVFRNDRWVAGRTEAEVYRSVGLPYIEPELRESRGEIEAARDGKLPRLVKLDDIRGDLHSHTNATDGKLTLEEMAEAARAKGYEYLAVTDHSRRLTVAHGLDVARLKQQLRKIDALNANYRGFRLLKSIEVDILEDGSLDLPDSILAQLDLTVCSVHSKFDLSETRQTERILRAMDHPSFRILGHPSGRLIGKRKAYELNLERIIRGARDRGRFLEVNSQPERMDLDSVYCKMAKEFGVLVSISTDAHSANDLNSMPLGLSQARRGWIEREDVLNTRGLKELLKLLR